MFYRTHFCFLVQHPMPWKILNPSCLGQTWWKGGHKSWNSVWQINHVVLWEIPISICYTPTLRSQFLHLWLLFNCIYPVHPLYPFEVLTLWALLQMGAGETFCHVFQECWLARVLTLNIFPTRTFFIIHLMLLSKNIHQQPHVIHVRSLTYSWIQAIS